MGVFQSETLMTVRQSELTPVAQAVMEHFRTQGFTVSGEQGITRGWHISLTKGALFTAVLGMQTALNIDMEPTSQGVQVKAGVGIFGKQIVPTAIAMFLFWPVLITQIWGMVKQAQLDEEALTVIEQALRSTADAGASTTVFCTECGAPMGTDARFCARCGKPVTPASV